MALKRLVHKQHRVKRARPNTYHWTGHTSNQSLWQRFGRPSSYNMCNNTSCTAVPVKQWNAFRGLFVYVVPYHVELHISRQHALYTQYRYTENRTRGGQEKIQNDFQYEYTHHYTLQGVNKKKNGTNVCSGRRNRVSIEQGSRLHSINGIKQRTLQQQHHLHGTAHPI